MGLLGPRVCKRARSGRSGWIRGLSSLDMAVDIDGHAGLLWGQICLYQIGKAGETATWRQRADTGEDSEDTRM